jgi:hypothetical protein
MKGIIFVLVNEVLDRILILETHVKVNLTKFCSLSS